MKTWASRNQSYISIITFPFQISIAYTKYISMLHRQTLHGTTPKVVSKQRGPLYNKRHETSLCVNVDG